MTCLCAVHPSVWKLCIPDFMANYYTIQIVKMFVETALSKIADSSIVFFQSLSALLLSILFSVSTIVDFGLHVSIVGDLPVHHELSLLRCIHANCEHANQFVLYNAQQLGAGQSPMSHCFSYIRLAGLRIELDHDVNILRKILCNATEEHIRQRHVTPSGNNWQIFKCKHKIYNDFGNK